MADIVKLTIKDETQYPLSIPEAIVDPNDNKPLSDTLPFVKDKKHNENEYSGMGRRYLKKNMIAGINVLEQSMFDSANTIYIIQYDFDLQGETITLPNESTLYFNGGKLKNGTLVNAKIVNISDTVIFNNINIIDPIVQEVKLKWFEYNSLREAFVNAAKFTKIDCTGEWNITETIKVSNDIEIKNGVFYCTYGIYNLMLGGESKGTINTTSIPKGSRFLNVSMPSDCTHVIIKSQDIWYKTTRNTPRNATRGEMFAVANYSNNSIELDTLVGTLCEYTNNVTILFIKAVNVSVSNCKFIASNNFSSDKGEVLLSINSAIATVRDSYFTGCSIGLAFGNCDKSKITNCTFDEIYPWAIAFAGGTSNSIVEGCNFYKNRHAWTQLGEDCISKNNIITGCVCKESLYAITSHVSAYNTTISNNLISDSNGGVGSYAPYAHIIGNVINNITSSASSNPAIILVEAGGVNTTVTDNIISDMQNYGESIRNTDINSEDIHYIVPEYFIAKNNSITNCPNGGTISVNLSKYNSDINISIENNTIIKYGYVAISVISNNAIINNNTIRNSIRGYQGITCDTQDSNEENSKLIITNNTVDNPYHNNNYAISINGYNLVYSNFNKLLNDLIIEYKNCDSVKDETVILPLASSKNNGLMSKTDTISHINMDSSLSGKYIKLGTFPNRWYTATLIISSRNTGGRTGGLYFVNICGKDGDIPSINYITIIDNTYVKVEFFVDTNGDVYIKGDTLYSIIYMGTGRNLDMNDYYDSIPDTCIKIYPQANLYNIGGLFENKPTNCPIGTSYFCTNKRASEDSEYGIIAYYKGSNLWVDALGRVIE